MTLTEPTRRLWQLAGLLALLHIALMLGGFALTPVARLGDPAAGVVSTYRQASPTATGIGSAVSLLGFLSFLMAALLLARLLRGSGEGTRWLASLTATAGALYVGLTFALPYAAAGAARYGARHGMPADTVAALSDLHWFGDDMATVMLGVFTLALAAGLWITRALPRWLAAIGFVVGACSLVTAVFPPEEVLDDVTLIWMVWFVVTGVLALRAGRVNAAVPPVPVTA